VIEKGVWGSWLPHHNEHVTPSVYATTEFSVLPDYSEFDSLREANKMRNQLKLLYDEQNKKDFASVTPCKEVYDPADTQCNSLCFPNSSLILV
jgi:hypothetical protein